MSMLNCCRLCLCVESLHPIFYLIEHIDKYTSLIFTTTGITVEVNDGLPQSMCSTCISFINASYKFRKKCEETQKYLSEQTNNIHDIKLESAHTFEQESKYNIIDISDFIEDDDFRDYDDNLTLDTFQSNCKVTETCEQFNGQMGTLEIKMSQKPKHDDCRRYHDDSTSKDNVKMTKKTKTNGQARKREIKVLNKKRKKNGENESGIEQESLKDKKSEKEDFIECKYCHKILTSRFSVRNHYKIHTGFDFVCEHCGKKFCTRRLLLMHCRARHGYEKVDKCSYCDYKASNAEQVKIHERIHTGEKPYACDLCGATFHRKSSQLQHIAIHLPEKTVQCDQCPSTFKSVTLMRIHRNKHRERQQYTFKCNICDNNFARKRNVARHLQRIHGLTPDSVHMERVKKS